jgi:hypothetical protein
MKYILLSLIVLLTACGRDPVEVKKELAQLDAQISRKSAELKLLTSNVEKYKALRQAGSKKLAEARKLKAEADAVLKDAMGYKNGNPPIYMIKVKAKQDRFSLSLSAHAKDEMNAFEFEIPVDKRYYDQLRVGGTMVKSFRGGSAFISGTASSMKLTVIKKYKK